ncbi:MAG: RNA polymerase sigma factor [Planctomycetota bacterium]|jgi:RNA polymerase sigma-70 factor (ECF subfamily)
MPSESATHASLLIRLRTGSDAAAWQEFSERYGELIRGFARRRGLQPADCEDVAQDVLLSMSKVMPGFSYDPSRGKFRSYLKTATLHAIFRRNRQNKGEIALGTLEEMTRCAATDAEVERAWELEWQHYHLRQAMRTLRREFNAADREAFRHYVIDGHDARDTARDLGLTVNQVYKAKSRILQRLEDAIAQQVEEEG